MAEALPLEGVKVLDLTWVMVGPATTRYLADYGATVVRVESTARLETGRGLQPFKDGQPHPERSAFVVNNNAGKYGITLNLTKPEGRDLLLRLVRWADVVAEAFSPKVMRAWGLDYETLRREKPDLIMLSTCLNGQTGPEAMFAGYGNLGAALAGFVEFLGWPDRAPAGPTGAYTDYVSPKFIAAALLAALDYRRRTGKGQYIDAAQAEAAMHFLTPAILDYTANGRAARRKGNRADDAAPHGVFPCRGEDRWVAIAVHTDAQWQAFCRATGHEEWLADPRFATFLARKRNEDALDAAVSEWTARHTREEAEETLQRAGVPAGVVYDVIEAWQEPQLNARGHFIQVEHADLGTAVVENSRIRLSRTPARITRGGPTIGQHNEHVLREILGMNDEEIAEAVTSGALE